MIRDEKTNWDLMLGSSQGTWKSSLLHNILCSSVNRVCTTVHSRHKISFELTNQGRLDTQNSLGIQVPAVQIKGLCKWRAWAQVHETWGTQISGFVWSCCGWRPDRQLFICSLVVCSVTITNANSKRQPNVDALICRGAVTRQNCNLQW